MDLFDRDLFFQIDASRVIQARLLLFLFPRILALGTVADCLPDMDLPGCDDLAAVLLLIQTLSLRPYSKKRGYLLPFGLIREGRCFTASSRPVCYKRW
jgi:hypothetical protein